MRDFLRFLRHLFRIVHFIRGVIVTFVLLLGICVVSMVFAEGMSVGQAVYLVLITSLTIGYGDITPTTVLGKITSVAAGVLGLLLSGLVIAVAVRALGDAVREKYEGRNEGP